MKNILKEIFLIGILALIIQASNSSFFTLISFIHKLKNHQSIGPILLITNASSFVLSNFFTPFLNLRIKYLI